MAFENSIFKKSLLKYANKNESLDINKWEDFKLGEDASLHPYIAQEIISLYSYVDVLKKGLEKECDYNRLLKKENIEIKEELEYLYSLCDNDDEEEKANSINYEYDVDADEEKKSIDIMTNDISNETIVESNDNNNSKSTPFELNLKKKGKKVSH